MSRGAEQPDRAGDGATVKPWALFVGTTVAVATATVLIALGVRRWRAGRPLEDVKDIIDECFDRIRQIEGEFRRSRPSPESAH